MLDIIKAYATNNLCYIAAQKMTPKGIVVHSTGANNPNLKRYVDAPDEVGINQYGNHWNIAKPDGREVCVHAFIGYDKNRQVRVAQLLPFNICCWGVGKGKKGSYNYNPAYIQFEICEDDLTNRNYYTEAFSLAAEFCADLCKTYGISVESIVGHFEAYNRGYGSNHSDPEHWMKRFGETMDDFRIKVSEIIKNTNEDAENKNINETVEIHKGDLVSITENAVYYNGSSVPSWVKKQNWYVKTVSQGDRVVIDKNESGTHAICSPINKKYLKLVKSVPLSTCPYLVKITTDSLNIRKGAGTNTAIVGSITDKGVYTIIEEKVDGSGVIWGKLKSGIGWISLLYLDKI